MHAIQEGLLEMTSEILSSRHSCSAIGIGDRKGEEASDHVDSGSNLELIN